MPRPTATEPIPTGKKALPWKFPIPGDVRHLHGDRQYKYFAKRGECLQFIGTLRRPRTEHTGAFNNLSDAVKAQLHEAYQILLPHPDARTLPELARLEAQRLDVAARSKRLSLVVEEMLAEKTADGARPNYIRGLRGCCQVFAKAFSDRLASSFTGPELAKWLRDTYANPNSRDSYRRSLGVLFAYARDKGYVTANPIAETKAVNARREEEVPILNPEQLTRLIQHAVPRLRPYLVVSAFAALRPSEAQQIAWENVTPKGIYVPKAITKTVARHVPVVPTLAAWLQRFDEQAGNLYPRGYRTWRRDFEAARKAAGLYEGWDQDVLRHSAISYWLAVEPNRAAVAMWSANSEEVQKRDYQNPRSAEQAAAWYAVTPEHTPSLYREPTRNQGGRPQAKP